MTQNEVYEYLRKLNKSKILTSCPNCGINKLGYCWETYDPDCGEWVIESIGIDCADCTFTMEFATNLYPSKMTSCAEIDSILAKLNKLLERMNHADVHKIS